MNGWRERAGDIAVYIAAAVAFAAGLVWYASASGPNGADLFVRWGGLALNTAILFGYLVKDSRRNWNALAFWALTVAMLSAHLVLFTLVLLHTQEWKVLWFLAMYPIEIPLFLFFRDRVITMDPPTHRMR